MSDGVARVFKRSMTDGPAQDIMQVPALSTALDHRELDKWIPLSPNPYATPSVTDLSNIDPSLSTMNELMPRGYSPHGHSERDYSMVGRTPLTHEEMDEFIPGSASQLTEKHHRQAAEESQAQRLPAHASTVDIWIPPRPRQQTREEMEAILRGPIVFYGTGKPPAPCPPPRELTPSEKHNMELMRRVQTGEAGPCTEEEIRAQIRENKRQHKERMRALAAKQPEGFSANDIKKFKARGERNFKTMESLILRGSSPIGRASWEEACGMYEHLTAVDAARKKSWFSWVPIIGKYRNPSAFEEWGHYRLSTAAFDEQQRALSRVQRAAGTSTQPTHYKDGKVDMNQGGGDFIDTADTMVPPALLPVSQERSQLNKNHERAVLEERYRLGELSSFLQQFNKPRGGNWFTNLFYNAKQAIAAKTPSWSQLRLANAASRALQRQQMKFPASAQNIRNMSGGRLLGAADTIAMAKARQTVQQ